MIEGRDTRNNKEGTEDDEGEVIEVNQKKVLKKWLKSDEDEEVEDEEEESLRHLQLDSGRCNFCCRVNTTNNNHNNHNNHNNNSNNNNNNLLMILMMLMIPNWGVIRHVSLLI